MKTGHLLLLLAAVLSTPSLLRAEGLPSVWKASDWSDRESLAVPRPNGLFWLNAAGCLEAHPSNDPAYDIPPAIRLLADGKFRKELLRESQTGEIDAFESEISRKVGDYERKFGELNRKAYGPGSREERIAAIDAFERETKALLSELRGRLTPAQQDRCARRYASALFYAHGPIEFARLLGATEAELETVGARLVEMHEPLRTKLRELETATFVEVLDTLKGEGIDEMRELVKSASPRRYGVLHTLHDDLANFDAPPVGVTKETSTHTKLCQLNAAGEFVVEADSPTDPLRDFLYLYSVQGFERGEHETATKLYNELFTEGLKPDSERMALKRKAGELKRRARIDKEADTFETYAELSDVLTQIFDLLSEDVEAVLRLMPDDGRRKIEEGRLMLYMQRYGCTRGLASKYADEHFNFLVDVASWKALGAKAPELAAALRERAVKVQQDVVKNLYADTSLARQYEEAWVRTVEDDYVPPLGLLVAHDNGG